MKLQDLCARAEAVCAEFVAHATAPNQEAALHAIWDMRARLDRIECDVRQIQPDEAPDTGKLEAVR